MGTKVAISFIGGLFLSLPTVKANVPDTKSFWYNNGKNYCNYRGPNFDPQYEGQSCPTACDYLSCLLAYTGNCESEEPYSCSSSPSPKK